MLLIALVGVAGVVAVGHNSAQSTYGRSRLSQPARPGWTFLAVLVFTTGKLWYLLRGALEAPGQTQYAPERLSRCKALMNVGS